MRSNILKEIFFFSLTSRSQQWAQNIQQIALATVAWLGGRCLANRKVTGSIPGQGTCLGCSSVPSWGCARGNRSKFLSHIDALSPSFFLPSPLSKTQTEKKKHLANHVVNKCVVIPPLLFQSRFSIILKILVFRMVDEHWLQLEVTSCIGPEESQPVLRGFEARR